jgi:hypothetical protein
MRLRGEYGCKHGGSTVSDLATIPDHPHPSAQSLDESCLPANARAGKSQTLHQQNLRPAIANISRLQRLANHRSSKWIDALAWRQLRDCGMQRN